MTLKWPTSHLLATTLSMVGAGKNPALGIGVGGEMGCQPTDMWRGFRQIGSARKAFGGRGIIVGTGTADGSISIAESATASRRKYRSTILLLGFETGQRSPLLEIRNNPGSFTSGNLRARCAGSGASKSSELLVDRIVWSPQRHSRCVHAGCIYKDPTSFSSGGRRMLSSFCPSGTLISTQMLGGQLLCKRESRHTGVASSSLYTLAGKTNWRVSSSIVNGASSQRRLSYFKSENLRWRKIFKVFSEDVGSREAVSNDLKSEEGHRKISVEERLTERIEEFEDTGERAVDGLAEKTRGFDVQYNEFAPNEEGQISKAGRVLEIPHKGHENAIPHAVNPSDVTVICFDIETTGLHPAYHRIIEFAARDLSGGEYSTIETLVNPDREVPLESERIHKISSKMVNTPDVPRWKDVALAIVRFVDSRRKGEGPVILVAHNGKRFDVPFIVKEFRDCEVPVPSYWRFADSMPLARSAMKSLGQKRPKVALTDLFNHYNLQSVGDAHRAMADVNMLAPVLQMVMNDLSMGVQELLEQSFSAEDLVDKGKVLPVNDVPPIDEIYDGVEVDGLETAVSSEVLETVNLEVAPQSYEAALGIEASSGAREVPGIASVPWDSSSDIPLLETEDEFEKSLGLTLGDVRNLSHNQPILEIEEERSNFDTSRLTSECDEHLLERHKDSPRSERDLLTIAASDSPSGGVVIPYREEPPIPTVGTTLGERRYESDPSNTWEGMSSSSTEGEKILADVDANWRGDRLEVVNFIQEDQAESLSEQSSEWQVGSNGSIWNSDGTAVANSQNLSEGNDAPLLTTTVDVSLLSPMMRQYVETKRQRDPKFLLLSQVGDFFEAFFEDAERLAEACNLRLTVKEGGKLLRRKIPMAGIPVQQIDKTLRTLLRKGIPVVRQEQVGEEENGVAIERRVTAVLTPGTLVDGAMLEESYNNFLVAILPPSGDDGTWGLAFSDISTGEFQATEVVGKNAVVQEILRLQPAEVLFPVGRMEQIDVDSPTPMGLPSQFCYSSRPQSEFSRAASEKNLQSHYRGVPLEAMGTTSFSRALRAAGGLLGYVQETQQMASEDLPLQKLKFYSASDSMNLSETVRKHLEMTTTSRWGKAEGSFIWAVDETRTAMGRRMLQKWLLWPLLQHKKIVERQDAVEVFVKNTGARKALRLELELLGDLERLTGRVGWKRANARDMLTVAQSLQALPKLALVVEGISSNPYITAVLKTPLAAIEMADRVQEMLVEESGRRLPGELIKSGVDTVLDEFRKDVEQVHESITQYEKQEQERTGIASLEVGYTRPHGHFISIRKTRLKDGNIPDDYRNIQSLKTEERFTTPVLQQYERLRLEALQRAAEREEELFLMLKDEMSALLEPVQEYSKAVAEVDVLCNFAEIAAKWGYCRPQVLEGGREISIVKGRHPVVERCLPEGIDFVPNSTYLGYSGGSKGSNSPGVEVALLDCAVQESGNAVDEAFGPLGNEEIGNLMYDGNEYFWPRPDVMILTGPNASGKSCYLRQIGLIQILAQAGSFVPARECRLSISDGLYTRVGSVDDLAAGQSTFKVEMSESADILDKATPRSLVLLDEVGRGTGSQEGEMIARAIIEYLAQQVKARTVFSTHYHELHVLDLELENVSNYHLEAGETSLGDIVFDHAVRPGFALRSYAVAVARASGMPEWICNRATELLVELTVADEGGVKLTGPTTLDGGRVQRQSTSESPDQHSLDRSSEDENQIGTFGGNTDGMLNTITIGKTSDNWFDVMKFSKRGKSIRGTVRTDSETGEVDVSFLDESQTLTVPENSGDQAEQAEYEEREVYDEASSWREENNSDIDVEAKIFPDVGNGISNVAEEDLRDIWNSVCAALQNRPATQALTRQKGILISVTRSSGATTVRMGASALFVKKFQQHEHGSALEAAFTTVLKQPVKLDVSILDTNHKKH